MKWTVKRDHLLDELRLIHGAIEKKSTIPTLSYFLIQAYEDHLKIVASDMELSYESSIPATVDVTGGIALPAKTVTDICRAFTEEEVVFELLDPPLVTLESGSTHYEVPGLSVDDYPIPKIPTLSDDVFTIPTPLLKQAIDYVGFVIPGHAMRDALLGALFHKEGNAFHAVAMDVFRLATFTATLETESGEDFSLLIHRKAIQQLREAITGTPLETVKFCAVGNLIIFELGNRRIVIRSIDDQFPKYQSYIPKNASFRIRTQRTSLLDACKRVALLSRGTRDQVSPAIQFRPKGEYLILQYHNPALGTARDKVEATFEGDPFTIYLNGDFVIDFLSAVQEEHVEFWFNSSSEPAAARPAGSPLEAGYYYVFMPINEDEIEDGSMHEKETESS